jgi:hypothetical protein
MQRERYGSAGRARLLVTDPEGLSNLVRQTLRDRWGDNLSKAAASVRPRGASGAKSQLSRILRGPPWAISARTGALLRDLVPLERHGEVTACLLDPEAQRLLHRYAGWLDEEVTRWGLAQVVVAMRRGGSIELVDAASPVIEQQTLAWEFAHFRRYVTDLLADDDEEEFDPIAILYSTLRAGATAREEELIRGLRDKRLLIAWARVAGPWIAKDSSGGIELDWREWRPDASKELRGYIEDAVRREQRLLLSWNPVRRAQRAVNDEADRYSREQVELEGVRVRRMARRRHKDLPITQLNELMERTLAKRPPSPLELAIARLRGS